MNLLSSLVGYHTRCSTVLPIEHAQLQMLELSQAVPERWWKSALLKCFGSGILARHISVVICYSNVESSIAMRTCSDSPRRPRAMVKLLQVSLFTAESVPSSCICRSQFQLPSSSNYLGTFLICQLRHMEITRAQVRLTALRFAAICPQTSFSCPAAN